MLVAVDGHDDRYQEQHKRSHNTHEPPRPETQHLHPRQPHHGADPSVKDRKTDSRSGAIGLSSLT